MDPHPVIVTIGDNKEYIRVLLYSRCSTIAGWGVLLNHSLSSEALRLGIRLLLKTSESGTRYLAGNTLMRKGKGEFLMRGRNSYEEFDSPSASKKDATSMRAI